MVDRDGQAGASARREHERRRARDEARLREEWGRLGGLAVALTPERQSTRAWSTGAVGEERVGAVLDSLRMRGARVLHDRRIPGTRANIDHLVVGASGVWVIDAKKYTGRPERVVEGGLFRPRVERLLVGRREKTHLVEGVLGQVARVRADVGVVPIRGVLCFVDADWPLLGGAFSVRGVDVVWPRKLTALIGSTADADLDVEGVADLLAVRFPQA